MSNFLKNIGKFDAQNAVNFLSQEILKQYFKGVISLEEVKKFTELVQNTDRLKSMLKFL